MRLPGTKIETAELEVDAADHLLNNLFLGGGLVLSQVTALTGLEPYIVQNWVKRGFLSAPVHKQYSKRQVCRIITINMLKDALPLDTVLRLLSYINGALDDESDDLIDDGELYNRYVNMLIGLGDGCFGDERLEREIERSSAGYDEKEPGARRRLAAVLRVMAYAHRSAEMKAKAEALLAEIDG